VGCALAAIGADSGTDLETCELDGSSEGMEYSMQRALVCRQSAMCVRMGHPMI
jgi:hypothetical protein